MKDISETFSRQLSCSAVSVAHKPAFSLRAILCRAKYPLPVDQVSNVYYRIPCTGYPCVYVATQADVTGLASSNMAGEKFYHSYLRTPLSVITSSTGTVPR
ncbi:unnamed protein product [Dibothriocephalus latus]|uniref:Uncharacterized protein n=1 Tax=Dibothriocephalus latus TaxID=60516 RepID=A0A3P6UHG0_DIBLA|nr:unnamed protein product [Dibothriocephalus latus]